MSVHDLVKVDLGYGYLNVDRSDPGISKSLLKRKPFWLDWHREPEFMDIMKMEVSPGEIAFDLGANLGYATLNLARLVGPKGTVIAVEPSQKNYQILQKNMELNGLSKIVKSFNVAISDMDSYSTFYLADETNLHSFSKTKHSKEEVKVKTVTIDSFFTELKLFPNFIKMDIEGAEVEALKGLDKILEANPNKPMKILMEVHPSLYNPEAFSQQLDRLFNKGFRTRYIVSTGDRKANFFHKKGYRKLKSYRSGDWVRSIFENVSNEDCKYACSFYDPNGKIARHWLTFLRRPYLLVRSFHVDSPKMVRSILLERV